VNLRPLVVNHLADRTITDFSTPLTRRYVRYHKSWNESARRAALDQRLAARYPILY
jgi:hypothetical protein